MPGTVSETIDFAALSRDELEAFIQDNLQTEFVGLKGANTDFVREAARVMSDFESRFGGTIEGLKIQFGGTPAGVYAKYDDATKTLLLKKTGTVEKYEESLRKQNARFRTNWHTDQDYHATDTYSGTIWHELGHAVDIESGQEFSRRLSATSALDQASVKVSAYAGSTQNVRTTRRSEAWAENFAAYMDGHRNKEKVPNEIRDMIESISTKPRGIDAADNRFIGTKEAGRLARAEELQKEKNKLKELLSGSITIGKPYIEPEEIRSPEFSRKFSRLTNDSRINDIIRSLAQGNLTKNNGSYTESLDIIDLDYGTSIIHKTGKKNALEVVLTAEEKMAVKKNRRPIIGMHNHPTNLLPTGSDFVAAASRGYEFGIIVTHDGRVFKYTPPTRYVTAEIIDAEIDKRVRLFYNDDEKRREFMKVLEQLGKEYGLTCEEL